MSDANMEDMNKAERLALAAAVAPSLRSASAKTLQRKVTLYDPETGKVTGYTTGAEALKGLARIQELEHTVVEGVRPKEVVCQNCGRTLKVGKTGSIPAVCLSNTGCASLTCSDCPRAAPRNVMSPSTVRLRNGKPWRCFKCANASRRSPLPGQKTCSNCPKATPKRAMLPSAIKRRGGNPWRCQACAAKDPGYLEKVTAKTRERFEDPDYRAKNATLVRKLQTDPEIRAAATEGIRKRFEDPDYRAKNAALMRKLHGKSAAR